MGAYLRGRWWWYRRTIDKHDYRRPLRLRKGQEGLLSARIAQMDDKITAAHFGLPAPSGGTLRFSAYAKTYLDRKKHNKSLYHVERRLAIIQKIWPDLPLGQYGPAHVRELEDALFAKSLHPPTVNRYMELLRNLWNCAIEDKEARDNPIQSYEAFAEDDVRRALTDKELETILAEARRRAERPANGAEAVFYDMALLSLATGMRLGLILNLKKEYVQNGSLVVPITSTKSKRRGGSQRERSKSISLSTLAREVIERQGKASPDEYVFPVSWRHPNFVVRTVRRIREATELYDWSFHSFRHTASSIIAGGSSLIAAQSVLGHADIKTTLRYSHVQEAEQRASVTKLGTHIRRVMPKSKKLKARRETG
jgi:integrase